MKTAIIGASGFVGRHLFSAFRRIHPDTIGTTFSQPDVRLQTFDIRQPNLRSLELVERGFNAVLIASAKPNIAYCEHHPQDASAVNVHGTLEVIRQSVELGLKPIFISSDYVFDGHHGNYEDHALTNPSTEYGRQKQFVECELPRITDDYLVLRLSKIYGHDKGDGTLLDEIASNFTSGREVRAAADQIFTPTFVGDLVAAIVEILERRLTGVINVCFSQSYSRHQVAIKLAQAMNVDLTLIKKISLHDIAALKGRPLNTSLIGSRLAREIGTTFTPLDESIRIVSSNWSRTIRS